MKLESKQDFEEDDSADNPKIQEDYYMTVLDDHEDRDDIVDYDRDGARGLVIKFRVTDEGVEVENDFNTDITDGDIVLPFFAPAKLSVSEEGQDSRLSEYLKKIGLHEPVLDILDDDVEIQTGTDEDGEPVFSETTLKEAVLEHNHRLVFDDEDSVGDLKDAVRAVFKGKEIRVNVETVEDDDGNESSQVTKFSKVFDGTDSESDDSDRAESDEDDEDVLFGEDDENSEEDDDEDEFV